MTEFATIMVPVGELKPNDYNPNVFSESEAEELLAEVQRLGRIPKPIVVRMNGNGYVIVDGEHNWQAAKDAGLADVPCEVIEADDFEAMRQTYKRNQHGTHNPIKQGAMFRRMLEARGLSQRQLAKEMEVSEGTVRNSLLFAEAAQRLGLGVARLSVKQLRWAMVLPETVSKAWINAGADIADLPIKTPYSEWEVQSWEDNSSALAKKYEELEGLFSIARPALSVRNFKAASADVLKLWDWESRWTRNGVKRADLRTYLAAFWKCFGYLGVKKCTGMFDGVLSLLIDTDPTPAAWRISAEDFASFCGGDTGRNFGEFGMSLRALIHEKTGELPTEKWDARERLRNAEIQANAPDYIKGSNLKADLAYVLWKAEVGKGHWQFPDPDPVEFEAAKRNVAERESVWYYQSPGWSDEAAVNYQISLVMKRESFEREKEQSTNTELAKALVEALGIYQADAARQARAYMIATLEQLTKPELLALLDTCREARGWVDREARIRALNEMVGQG